MTGDADYENDSPQLEVPGENVNLTLTPSDIDRLVDGGEVKWTGSIPGVKLVMTAEVLVGEEDGSE